MRNLSVVCRTERSRTRTDDRESRPKIGCRGRFGLFFPQERVGSSPNGGWILQKRTVVRSSAGIIKIPNRLSLIFFAFPGTKVARQETKYCNPAVGTNCDRVLGVGRKPM